MIRERGRGPDVDAIRVLALAPPSPPGDVPDGADLLRTGMHWRFPVLRRSLCSDAQAARAVHLWNALPDGEGARCHIPGFALEFLIRDGPALTTESTKGFRIVFTAALCWQCNTISFAGDLAPSDRRTFDAGSEAAVRLLRLCEEVAGEPDRP